jgi:hypothetical protein
MNEHYSSFSFLVVVIGLYIESALVINKTNELYHAREFTPTLWFASILPQCFLILAATLITFVWWHKIDQIKTGNSTPAVELAQSFFPVLIATGLSIHVFIEVIYGGNDIDETLLAQSGLKVFPLMIFFVLRDTTFSSITAAWVICLISLFACCVYTQSFERFTALLSYFCTTCIIFYDSHRQSKSLYTLIDRLQETLAENERLAVEAQALELRAMIGNVAHDLKTVS